MKMILDNFTEHQPWREIPVRMSVISADLAIGEIFAVRKYYEGIHIFAPGRARACELRHMEKNYPKRSPFAKARNLPRFLLIGMPLVRKVESQEAGCTGMPELADDPGAFPDKQLFEGLWSYLS